MSTTSKLAMNRKIVPMNALGTVALAIVLCGVCQSQSQGPKTPYPSMAPIEQYLMDRNAEIPSDVLCSTNRRICPALRLC